VAELDAVVLTGGTDLEPGRVEIGAAGEHHRVELRDLLVAPVVPGGDDHGAGPGGPDRLDVMRGHGHSLMICPGAGHHAARPCGDSDERATAGGALRHEWSFPRAIEPPVGDSPYSMPWPPREANSVSECDGPEMMGRCGPSDPGLRRDPGLW